MTALRASRNSFEAFCEAGEVEDFDEMHFDSTSEKCHFLNMNCAATTTLIIR